MSSDFRMPSLGPDMESGTLVAWQVKPGDSVKRGDIVALVETDKGVIDVEIFTAGTVEKLLVEPGMHVPVGTALATLSDGETSGISPAVAVPLHAEEVLQPERATAPVPESAQAGPGRRQKISPAARARARALGIDVTKVSPTGAGGVVTLDDVNRVAATPSAAAEPLHAEHAPDMRRIIGKAMSRSKQQIPHYYLSLPCSFLAARHWLEQHNATAPIAERLLPSVLLLKAVALAARALPDFNGFYRDDEFVPAPAVHVGMAIAMRGGRLVAPAILDADRKTLPTLMCELRDLTARVRGGHMRSSELAMPTITVTSLAEEGIDMIVPVIYPPQVAIVGFGSIADRPWIVDGTVQSAPVVTITLAADHRVTDGRAGARFLSRIRDALQKPEQL